MGAITNYELFVGVILTEKMIKGYIETELRRYEFSYAAQSGYLTLTAGLGGRRWKMAISCGENRITCYSAYPWRIPGERRATVLERLNEFNAACGLGSYFLLDAEQGGLAAFRCDIPVTDIYSISECFEEGLRRMSAAFYARWGALLNASRNTHSSQEERECLV